MEIVPRNLIKDLEDICKQLVSRNQSDASVFIYTHLIDPILEEKYGYFLLKEMLKHKIVMSIVFISNL